jgi:hypothetical protein
MCCLQFSKRDLCSYRTRTSDRSTRAVGRRSTRNAQGAKLKGCMISSGCTPSRKAWPYSRIVSTFAGHVLSLVTLMLPVRILELHGRLQATRATFASTRQNEASRRNVHKYVQHWSFDSVRAVLRKHSTFYVDNSILRFRRVAKRSKVLLH